MPLDADSRANSPDADLLGDYTAHLAHDLNNVFSVVIGSLGIVLEEYPDRPLDDEAVTLVEDAVSAGREGARLIDALLGAAGRQALRRSNVAVADVIGSVEEILARSVESSIAVRVAVEPGAGDVWADRDRLRQCLLALAENGCEAMCDGGVLRLEAGRVMAADGATRVALRVCDYGAGMSDDVLARAREVFYTTRSPRRGRGLGLSVADGFATQSGGALEIQSTPGAGTTVTLWMPAA